MNRSANAKLNPIKKLNRIPAIFPLGAALAIALGLAARDFAAGPPGFGNNQVAAVTNAPPAQQVVALANMVEILQVQGVINPGAASKLDASLRTALDRLKAGSPSTACDLVAEFMAQIQSLMDRGRLAPALGQSLLTSASQLRTALGCAPPPT